MEKRPDDYGRDGAEGDDQYDLHHQTGQNGRRGIDVWEGFSAALTKVNPMYRPKDIMPDTK